MIYQETPKNIDYSLVKFILTSCLIINKDKSIGGKYLSCAGKDVALSYINYYEKSKYFHESVVHIYNNDYEFRNLLSILKFECKELEYVIIKFFNDGEIFEKQFKKEIFVESMKEALKTHEVIIKFQHKVATQVD